MNRHLLDRRQFNALCSAAGLLFPAASVMTGAQSGVSVLAADSPPRTVRFQNGIVVPAIGQGSWHIGQGRHPAADEEEALRSGVSLGMTLIDTSGNYGEGRSEELIKRVIAGQRDRAFVVSRRVLARRVLPGSALIISISICCTRRLRTPNFPRS